jgi:hypothetical protein
MPKMRNKSQANTTGVVSEFQLSRIQAEGWNAARKYLVNGNPADTKKIAALNPYTSAPERERWDAGFGDACAQQ